MCRWSPPDRGDQTKFVPAWTRPVTVTWWTLTRCGTMYRPFEAHAREAPAIVVQDSGGNVDGFQYGSQKVKMPTQDPNVCNKLQGSCSGLHRRNGHQRGQALHPLQEQVCQSGSPGGHRHPGVHRACGRGRLEAAYQVINRPSLPAVCGRVCPQESQCEGAHPRHQETASVGIGRLERFVADWHRRERAIPHPSCPSGTGHKAFIIGGRPPPA